MSKEKGATNGTGSWELFTTPFPREVPRRYAKMDRPDPALAERERQPSARQRKSPEPAKASREIEIRLIWRLTKKQQRERTSAHKHQPRGWTIKTAVGSALSLERPSISPGQSKLSKRLS